MFLFKLINGSVKEWKDDNGNVVAVLKYVRLKSGQKTRVKYGKHNRTQKAVMIYTPAEYEKLTGSQEQR